MKFLKHASVFFLMALLVTFFACKEEEEPEPDDTVAPVVSITHPADGSTVQSTEATVSVTVEYQVTDNVEITSVVIEFDGTQVAEQTSFTDYRVVDGEQVVDNVADGSHTVTITATDIGDNTTTESATFTKVTVEPYEPLDNEIFYMAFEGNYMELVSGEDATEVGTPGFAGEGKEGDDAYAGAENAYLTFATDNLQPSELTVSLFMKVNNVPDRAGILVMSPPDPDNPSAPNVRTSGFRFFREAADDNQIFKLNVGTGDAEVWLDGGVLAHVEPNTGEWTHFAFIIGATSTTLYIDGVKVAENTEFAGIDWTGCDIFSIMSGAPRYTGWNHFSDLSYLDELRIFDKALSEAELEAVSGVEIVQAEIPDPDDPGLTAIDGPDATEVLYMSFDTDFTVEVAAAVATEVGSPSVVDGGVSGKAYSGDTASYLTIPTAGLLNEEFSASMWIKLDPEATRAGILTIGAPDTENPEAPNNRKNGIRFFREGNATQQTFKLNVGDGEADTWVDGGAFATFSATREGWLHLAITAGRGQSQVYLNGILAAVSADTVAVDWTDCDIISFGSGAPRFTGWNHLGETSLLDELRLYNGILNPAQIATLKAVGD
jgi:hypothetical protein